MAVADPDTGEPWRQFSLQHRKARGAGGSKDPAINDAVNLLLLDGTGTTGCHGRAEHDPVWASEMGYRVSQWQDPATVPVVVHWRSGAVMLTPGGWAD